MNVTRQLDRLKELAKQKDTRGINISQRVIEAIFGEDFSFCFCTYESSLSNRKLLYFEENNQLYTCSLPYVKGKGFCRTRLFNDSFYHVIDRQATDTFKKRISLYEDILKKNDLSEEKRMQYENEILHIQSILHHPKLRLRALFIQ